MIVQASPISVEPQPESCLFTASFHSNLADTRFKVFSILWAIASLFHMAHSSIFDIAPNLALLTLAALYVLFRPSLTAFVVFITLQLFDALFRMPFTTNHWIFTAFVNLSILHCLLYLIIKNRSFHVTGGSLFKTVTPILRIELIILYCFTTFHKLNSGFFSPVTSCATELMKAQPFDNYITLIPGIFTMNAYFTLLLELSIPVLLCFKRTRNLAVLIGLFFHGILSYSTYNAFYDFSSMVFAVYFLFIGPAFTQRFFEMALSLKRFKQSFFAEYDAGKILTIAVVSLILLVTLYVMNKHMYTFQAVHLYFFWTIYSLSFTALFLRYMFSKYKITTVNENTFRFRHWSLLLIPTVVFVNGVLPYLGLKTENSFAMFSNLRTEGGKTNHYIVPASVQIFDFQKDVVQIVCSTDVWLEKLATQNKALVLFEFRNFVHRRKPDRVEYLLNGEKFIFEKSQAGSFQALGSNPYALRKLMKFRPFTVDEPQPCAH